MKFYITGIRMPVVLNKAKTLEFLIGGTVWKFNVDKPIDMEILKLENLLKGKSVALGFNLVSVAFADSPNSFVKDLTYTLGAIAILALVVTGVAAVPLTVATGAVAGAALVIGGMAGAEASIAGIATLAAALYWGGSSLADRIKYGKASLVCKDGFLYAKIDGKEINIDRNATFSDNHFFDQQALIEQEQRAVDAFFEKYRCNQTMVGSAMSKLKSILTEHFSSQSSSDTPIDGSVR